MSASTLTGWTPWTGALVWLTVYNPAAPTWEAILADRVDADLRVGERRLMRLAATRFDKDGVTHWYLVDATRGGDRSWADDQFCVLEDASDQETQPDLLALLGMTSMQRTES
jgi:hypothetical protein